MQVSDEMIRAAARVIEPRPWESDYDVGSVSAFNALGREERAMETARAALTAALALSGWRTIDSAPKDKPVLLAAYIIPSEEAQRNGSQAFWDIAIGRAYGTNLDRWSGILGTRPSHWMPRPAPPATAGKEG